jgi:uncharacterized membrane protein YhiD involved in acid resistance
MFTNPGKKIKTVSIIAFWISILVYVVLAFTVGVDAGAGVFILMLIACPICAYLSTLFLVAFGELVENSSKPNSEKKREHVLKEEEKKKQIIREQLTRLNLTQGKEAEADPYLTDEEIEAELEAEINK